MIIIDKRLYEYFSNLKFFITKKPDRIIEYYITSNFGYRCSLIFRCKGVKYKIETDANLEMLIYRYNKKESLINDCIELKGE